MTSWKLAECSGYKSKMRTGLLNSPKKSPPALAMLQWCGFKGVFQPLISLSILQEEVLLKRVRSDSSRSAAEAEQLRHQTHRQREELEALQSQRQSLEAALSQLRKERSGLEQGHKSLQRKVIDLKRLATRNKLPNIPMYFCYPDSRILPYY